MLFCQDQLIFLCIAFVYVTILISGGMSGHVNCILNYTEFGVNIAYSEENLCVLRENILSFTCNNLDEKQSGECLRNLCLKPHETLQILDLSRNHFTDITRGCFSKLRCLEILNISNNDQLGFNYLYNAMYGLNQTNIKEIYANNINQVGVTYPFPKNISLLLHNTSLRKLQLNYNEIQTIESGSIFYLPRALEDISVRGNRLEIGLIFFELVWLINLTRLDISFQCSTLEYRSRSRRNIEYIDDFDNNTNFENCPNDITYVNALKVLPSNLTTLIATGLLSGPKCIPLLSTRRNSKLSEIDISMDGFFKWVGPISVDPNSNTISKVNLSHNQCQFIEDGFFDNLTQLTTLDISYNYLGDYFHQFNSKDVFKGLKHLKKLDMRSSNIRYLPKTLLNHNKGIESLVLANNAMDEWTLDISNLDNLSYVDCSHNKLVTIPEYVTKKLDMLSKVQNITVDFHHNKILCTCENLHFLHWLFTTRAMVRLSAVCTGYNGNITQAYPYLSEECSKDLITKEWLYVVQTICFLFILSFFAVIYKKRWALIYRWYLFRLRQKGYTPIGGCEDGYQYDAFLSFADEDKLFVERVVTELEENSEFNFKVCFHYRDFTPGKSISKNIVSSVHSSRKTIVFMSCAYLRSHWCKYELQMAVTEERHMDRKLIVMIVLEDIPRSHLSLEVLYYYKKNSYIVKPKNEQEFNLFWKTLKSVVANDL